MSAAPNASGHAVLAARRRSISGGGGIQRAWRSGTPCGARRAECQQSGPLDEGGLSQEVLNELDAVAVA